MERRRMFKIDFGVYMGVNMDEKAMKKVAKLLYKQNKELKELLISIKNDLYVYNQTLAYPNGKQEIVEYLSGYTWDSIDSRIDLMNKMDRVKSTFMYMTTDSEEAIKEHMMRYDENTSVIDEIKGE